MQSIITYLILVVGGALVIPTIVIFIFWYKSFNKQVICIKELGDDPNNANVFLCSAKITNMGILGDVIKFYPGFGFTETKRFGSNYWLPVYNGKKRREGLALYWQGRNPRPMKVTNEDGKYYLDIIDEDNREFILDRELWKIHVGDDNKIMFGTVAALVFGGIIIASIFIGSIVIMQNQNILNTLAQQIVIGG